MEMVKNNFNEMSICEMQRIDGGLLGLAWLTVPLLLKITGAGITLGAGAVTIYFASK